MEPFTWAVAGDLLVKFGPIAFVYAEKIIANIEAGRANQNVTASDLGEMNRLAENTSDKIAASMGIVPPPPATPGT